jgi:hypothetical protein
VRPVLVGPNLDFKVIVAPLQNLRKRCKRVNIDADHVEAHFLECVVKGRLVIFALTFSKADQTVSIADKEQNTALVDSVKRSDVCRAVSVQEHHSEVFRVEHFCGSGLKVTFGPSLTVDLIQLSSVKITVIPGQLLLKLLGRDLVILFGDVEPVLVLLAATELFEHDHFVLAVLGRFGQQFHLLGVLGHVDYTCPVLLVFRSKITQELVELRVALGQALDAGIEGLSRLSLFSSHKVLQLFDFADCLGASCALGNFRIEIFVAEEEHARLLVLVCVEVSEDLSGNLVFLGTKHGFLTLQKRRPRTYHP